MKILIVDDNAQVRQLLRDYLLDSFDEVYECDDSRKALNLFETYLPDWVLIDWEMPNMDGIAVIRLIMTAFPNARICMLTAFDEEEIRFAAMAAGASGFVSKVNLFELDEILGIQPPETVTPRKS